MSKIKKGFLILLISLTLNVNFVFADEIHACENPEILRVIYFGKLLFDVVKIVVPIGLIVFGMIDFSKAMTSNDENAQKKNASLFVKRIIYAVLVFAVPWIVEVVMVYLGNLTEDVNFTDCLENANETRIAELEEEQQEETTSSGTSSSSSGSGSSSVNFSDEAKVKIKYDDAIVENLAAFVGSEVGGNKEGFEAQLITASVFINNMYYPNHPGKDPITSPSQVTLNNMCTNFKYGSLYTSDYCNLTFEKVSEYRGSFTETQKKQLTIVAKLVLSGTFTIPKQINGQGNLSNWGSVGVEWGTAITRSGCNINKSTDTGCSVVFAYSKYYPMTNEDVYGTKVSTNFSDYESIANTLYKKYVEGGKEIF